jgi:glycosyltransferase involved in cell wall biosynthesis
MLPDSRVECFGLPRRNHRSILPIVAPLVAWQRFAPSILPAWQSWIFVRLLDRMVTRLLEPCDVFICMSGIFVDAAYHASKFYNAQVWLERGSRHILSQAEILRAVPGSRQPSSDIVARELEGYRVADRIVIPSRHVAESFERDTNARQKLFINPYGTSLDMFPYGRPDRPPNGPVRLVFAGSWSRRKGCDILEQAVRRCDGVALQHVGPIGDQAFPSDDARFQHLEAVAQSKLVEIYHASDIFVHPSREEGLSVVQVQALASGLPLICSNRTGGQDLAHTPLLKERIISVPHDDPEALRNAIELLRRSIAEGFKFAPLGESDRATLSWAAYAKRYEAELLANVCEHATRIN